MGWNWPWNREPTLASVDKKMDVLIALVKTNHKEGMAKMATFDERISSMETKTAAALVRIDEDVVSWTEEIAALKALIAQGQTLTPEQEARMDALEAVIDGIDPRKPDVVPGS